MCEFKCVAAIILVAFSGIERDRPRSILRDES